MLHLFPSQSSASGGRSELLVDCRDVVIGLLAIVAIVVSPVDWELER